MLTNTDKDVATPGKGWHALVKRCIKAIESEIKHQTAGKRKTLDLSCCNCLKDIVKRAGRQPGPPLFKRAICVYMFDHINVTLFGNSEVVAMESWGAYTELLRDLLSTPEYCRYMSQDLYSGFISELTDYLQQPVVVRLFLT